MTPHGALVRVTKNLQQIGQFEGLEALEAYITSDECRRLLILAQPTIRRCYEKARERCQSGVVAKGTRRAQWDERMLGLLRVAHAAHGGDHVLVAKQLRITADAAKRAIERYIDATTEKLPRSAQESRLGSGLPNPSRPFSRLLPPSLGRCDSVLSLLRPGSTKQCPTPPPNSPRSPRPNSPTARSWPCWRWPSPPPRRAHA